MHHPSTGNTMSENLTPAEYAATPDGITELRRQFRRSG